MQASVPGRVRNAQLKPSQVLRTVFEAIVNSIHALEDADRLDGGRISVSLMRSSQLALLGGDGQPGSDSEQLRDVTGFIIRDNGVGFTQANYDSFNRSDSTYKLQRGGRGVGRFLWLKAFERVEVESVYSGDHGKRRRSFTFKLTEEGIDNATDEPSGAKLVHTTVKLLNARKNFQKHIPKRVESVARLIFQHCLEFFVLEKAPLICVQDEDGTDEVYLADLYKEFVTDSQDTNFKIEGHAFKLRHFLLDARSKHAHHLCLCANHRVVKDVSLTRIVHNLLPRLDDPDQDRRLVYNGYLSSPYLDERVNQERTGFALPEREESVGFIKEDISEERIRDTAAKLVQEHLAPFLSPIQKAKLRRFEAFVQERPQYRPLLRYRPEQVDSIPPGLKDDKLDLKLYEIQKDWQYEVRQKAIQFLKEEAKPTDDTDAEALRSHYSHFLEEWNDQAKVDLAQHVIHRKVMLEILERLLERRESGRYSLEATVHKTIFPLRSTSDEVPIEQQNLWILDEKLAYHRFLASDVPLKKSDAIVSDDTARPDLLIFNRPIAVVGGERPYSSIVIFEFKRPMRADYNDGENPIRQVLSYVRKIRNKNAIDRVGRPIPITDATPFYCYIVADLTPKLRTQAEDAGYIETPDGEGFYHFNPNHRAYIEIMSFDKLVQDAKKRNRVLFDKLNILDPL